jgi:hypothetical protein
MLSLRKAVVLQVGEKHQETGKPSWKPNGVADRMSPLWFHLDLKNGRQWLDFRIKFMHMANT